MTEQEGIEHKKRFNKAMSKMRSEASIKDCFHPNKSECVLPIKSAHSLQRQGALKILEKADDSGNLYLYLHSSREPNSGLGMLDFVKVGRKSATTFFGFCSYHDTELFKVIENDPDVTDIASDEHCFLHSYRSFALAYHNKYQDWKLYNSTHPEILKYLKVTYPGYQMEAMKQGTLAALQDLTDPKHDLDDLLLKKDYGGLDYLVFEYDYTIPIASASYISPHHLPSGKMIQMDPYAEQQSAIIVTVLPFKDRSVVILAAFQNDKIGCDYLDTIDSIKYEIIQQKFLSFFLFEGTENVVVSPYYIDKYSMDWRKRYSQLISHVASNTTNWLPFDKKFPYNYFDQANAL